MGGGSSVSQGEVDELLETTKFKKTELKKWYKKFAKDYPDGQLDKEHFRELFYQMSKSAPTNEQKTDHIFRMFDHNHDGKISFKELMSTLSVTTRGSVREKVEWVFDIYDVDGNGMITMEELSDVVTCIIGQCQDRPNTISVSKVTAAFMAADSDNDGYLTLDEFVDVIEALPELISILNSGIA